MLYQAEAEKPKSIYNNLKTKLQDGGSLEEIRKEIEEYCTQCNPSNPLTCVELCEIWKLKEKSQEHNQDRTYKSIDLINSIKNSRRTTILEIISIEPLMLEELQQKIKEKGYYHSRSTILHYIEPLIKLGLVEEENKIYKITEFGRRIYNILRTNIFLDLPTGSKGYEEIILKALRKESKTYDELAAIVPRKILPRILKRLRVIGLIFKSGSSDRVFFFKAKRRPTRKLSPTESRIFYTIPKNGISAKELSKKISINIRRTYKYLRRLMIKKHVSKYKRSVTYAIAPKGVEIVESIDSLFEANKASLKEI